MNRIREIKKVGFRVEFALHFLLLACEVRCIKMLIK